MKAFSTVVLAAIAAMILSSSVLAGDWPQWRGPARDGVAPTSPELMGQGVLPRLVWQSEPIPGGTLGGYSQPVVAGDHVFVLFNCHYDVPLIKRVLTEEALVRLGWMPGMPEDLIKSVEAARQGDERAKIGNVFEAEGWSNAWAEANLKLAWTKFKPAVTARLILGSKAIPLDILARLVHGVGKEFAGQGEFEYWLKEEGVNGFQVKEVMKVIPTTTRTCTDSLYCLDRATGKTLWQVPVPGDSVGYPSSSTPTVVGDRIYLLGSGAIAHCFDVATGAELWHTKPLAAGTHRYSRTSSVLVWDRSIMFGTDSGFYAFDADTGKLTGTAKDGKGVPIPNKEASPIVLQAAKNEGILFAGESSIYCIEILDGKAVWSVPAGHVDSTPVVSDDVMVFCSWTRAFGITAYQLNGATAGPKLWSIPFQDGFTAPVVSKGYAYVIGGANEVFGDKDKGRALCIELKTGKIMWDEFIGPDAQLSSPILADGKILAVVGSRLYVIVATPDGYRLLGKPDLGLAPASPAFADGRIYVRGEKSVLCYDLRATP